MTDKTVIVTTLMVLQWMSLEKTGKAGGYYYGENVFYNNWL